MARVTLIAEGLQTLEQVRDAIVLAEAVGFPSNSKVDAPSSGIAGGRLSFTTSLYLLPTSEDGGDEQ